MRNALLLLGTFLVPAAFATPSNKAALERHYDQFLGAGLNRCATCHLPREIKDPRTLEEFPHNPFGDRLRALGGELERAGRKSDIATRLALVAAEDADGDGADNETELLAGTAPGDATQCPTAAQRAEVAARREAFRKMLASYRWQPFERVTRPPVPAVQDGAWVRSPIDAFVAAEREQRGLRPRPEAPKSALLRRVHLDLTGLSPTPEEQRAFEADTSPDAYAKVVDRLLADPRHGERWGRHWMDVWRYSDWAGWTDGKQVRDSQRHIWRWRDWIVESLNADKPYDRMIVEMLAADELAPDDTNALRATGFLVRNYKMLSREAWLEDTVKHTAQAFLGITLGCAKCHDHRTDPISQAEYYQVRAIFEPHQVRTDRIPGVLDTALDGLVRAYDAGTIPVTYFFHRGDERQPDKERPMQPAVPRALCGGALKAQLSIAPVSLTRNAAEPDRRDFVIRDLLAAEEAAATAAAAAWEKAKSAPAPKPGELAGHELAADAAAAKRDVLRAVLRAEAIDGAGKKASGEWDAAARDAAAAQRRLAVADAKLALHRARRAEADAKDAAAAKAKVAEAGQALEKAEKDAAAEPTTAFAPRSVATFPQTSTGRRLAFARWIADPGNPLAARVAVNQIWLRHFGRAIVATPENFGMNGARPSHPALLDWLASELMAPSATPGAAPWSMKHIHRLLVMSATYRMASTPDDTAMKADTDNVYLWRMPSRRMEAELVRDNVLHCAGSLDAAMGGPDIDNALGLTSTRRSIYLRIAAEREVEFLKIFDGPAVSECYQRRATVMPQQALALANSELPLAQAGVLAGRLAACDDAAFIEAAFRHVLGRPPTARERAECGVFLAEKKADPKRARANLVLVLFNHNDFVTIR